MKNSSRLSLKGLEFITEGEKLDKGAQVSSPRWEVVGQGDGAVAAFSL